jgi:DNA-binding transcriptional MocR family regulator
VAETISFARGAPSLDIVDVDGLREAAERAFTNDPARVTAYGTSVGYPPLREWIAERHQVEPKQVIVTNGSMQADAFLFDALVEAGAQPKLAHVIPNFQNPAGYTLSASKRERLLELARSYEFTVFEDDPYVALRFEGPPLATMLSMDGDTVVYASSFSKTVCPGIRVGYLVGPAEVIARVGTIATQTYISPSMVSQAIVYEFCRSGALERSIETVKAALRERAHTLGDALGRAIPDARFRVPDGGYFMWVELPRGTDVAALFDAAAQRGVQFVKGADFVLDGADSALRLAYSGVTPEEIEEGVRRLAEAYGELSSTADAA